MNTQKPDLNTAVQDILRLIQAASLARLKNYSSLPELKLVPMASNKILLEHWMTFILMAHPSFKILFKVHYSTHQIREFATMYQSLPQGADIQQLIDFTKEFSNLTAGVTKLILAEEKLAIGTSLPLLTRGFDEIFSPRPDQISSFHSSWKIEKNDGKGLNCSASITIKDPIPLYRLNLTSIDERVSKTYGTEFL